jgi:small subunit ribosomal protein S1
VEGLCHKSEIPTESRKRQTEGDELLLPLNEELDFKVIKMNEAQKRIGLSLRAMTEDEERIRLQDYQRQAAIATSTVGDVIKQHSSEEPESGS